MANFPSYSELCCGLFKMFAARQRFVLLLIADLCLGAYGAPAKKKQEKTDPELTAGYFHGNMDVKFQRSGLIDRTRHWPNATVHYKIDEAFNTEQTKFIKVAMRRIGYVSCIRFVPASPETSNYLLVVKSNYDTYYGIGYHGGKHTMNLKPNVAESGLFKLGNIEHKLLHVLGINDQQRRSDRDEYVKINWDNIMQGQEQNYQKVKANEWDNFGVKYDYGSVMHYGPMRHSKNGKPTFVTLKPIGHLRMGQQYAMSTNDINLLNKMYNCPLQL